MRITNGMMVTNLVANMQTSMQKVDKYMNQLGSGKKINKLSDDPVGVLNALTARGRLARFEQYQKNLNSAKNWVDQCDNSLQELSKLMTQVRTEVIDAATSIKTTSDRHNIVALVKELKQTMVESLNSSVGKQYIFAGYNTTNAPFTIDDSGEVLYNGLSMQHQAQNLPDGSPDPDLSNPNSELYKLMQEANQQLKMEVGFSYSMDVTLNGLQVVGWGDDNLFAQLDEIIRLMEDETIPTTDAVNELSNMLGSWDKAHSRVTTSTARVGAMQTRIDMLDNRYAADIVNYEEIRSKIEDVDTEEAAIYWKMSQYVYEQTLAVGARIIQPSLMDFLS